MPHRVSVITPSYNQGRFIERTISSVLSQRFPGSLEYLVIDGGSTDETVAVLKRHGDCLQWVSEKDHGQADGVNKGLARATGDIIGWLNSDDVYYPDAIAAACEALDSHPEADVVYGEADHIDKLDAVIEPYPTEAWDAKRLSETCYLCQPAVFFRKRVVDRFGPLNRDLQFCMDYDYWLRLAAGGARFLWLRQKLAGSRLYVENKTLGSRVGVHAEINDVLRGHLGRVPDQNLFIYAHIVLEAKGIPRSDGVRFPLLQSVVALYAALRWNHRISREMVRTTSTWARTTVLTCTAASICWLKSRKWWPRFGA
jgi:glycosyltransferase involved in cell wall biosynthesis